MYGLRTWIAILDDELRHFTQIERGGTETWYITTKAKAIERAKAFLPLWRSQAHLQGETGAFQAFVNDARASGSTWPKINWPGRQPPIWYSRSVRPTDQRGRATGPGLTGRFGGVFTGRRIGRVQQPGLTGVAGFMTRNLAQLADRQRRLGSHASCNAVSRTRSRGRGQRSTGHARAQMCIVAVSGAPTRAGSIRPSRPGPEGVPRIPPS